EVSYDETRLRIGEIGWFAFDGEGNLDIFGVEVENVDTVTHSGTLFVVVDTQSFDYNVENLGTAEEVVFLVDVDPNLPTATTITISLSVITTA
ncbi:MAG: hypothetical protein ACE5KD_01575, partial [Candidatus Bathyarchaeia archaeon]